jgi:hypothetical protein
MALVLTRSNTDWAWVEDTALPGVPGPTGPAGPAPSGTGLVRVTNGSLIAPANLSKAEVEGVLTGVITTHSHAGGDADVSLYKGADQTITSAGYVDITGMTFAVAAGKAYSIEAHIVFRTSDVLMGVLIGFNGPASPALASIVSRREITAVATAGTDKFTEAVISAYNTSNPVSVGEIAANANLVQRFVGVFVNGVNAGTFALRLSKENVTGTATIKAGSWLKYRLLN